MLICLFITAVTWGIGVAVPVIWGVIEAILILGGRVHDTQGLPLREVL